MPHTRSRGRFRILTPIETLPADPVHQEDARTPLVVVPFPTMGQNQARNRAQSQQYAGLYARTTHPGSRTGNGRRPRTWPPPAMPPSPSRSGWFTEYYEEPSTWSEVPAAFRDWTEHEDRAATLRVWSPGIVHGLLQIEDYAGALLSTYPGVTAETVSARLAARMQRQRRLAARDVPSWFIVDELSLLPAGGRAGDHDQRRCGTCWPSRPCRTSPSRCCPPSPTPPPSARSSSPTSRPTPSTRPAASSTPGKRLRPSHGSSIAYGQSAAKRRSQRRYWKGWPRHGLAEVLSQRGQRRVLRRGGRHRAVCPSARHHRPRRPNASVHRRGMARVRPGTEAQVSDWDNGHPHPQAPRPVSATDRC